MGKLRASLYSLGARGRLGGHRHAPGAALAPVGPMWHKDLLGLGADDHAQYALLAGRALGQLLIGGTASGEHVTLQSTAHATRGYVRAQDDVQLLSNVIRGSDGVARLGLAAASPHVTLTGDVQLTAHASAGSGASPNVQRAFGVIETIDIHPAVAGYFLIYGNRAAGLQFTYGLSGGARGQGTPSASFVYGLYFFAQHDQAGPCYQLGGVFIQQQSGVSGTGALSVARAFYASLGYWGGSKPSYSYGLDVEDQGSATTIVAYGLMVDDQTGVTVRLLELGPATPYLRVTGGGVPAANTSHLHLSMGGTLKNVTEYNANSAGAGFRALRVPN